VDAELNVVLPARRVELSSLESWMKKNLTRQDEVVLEMTTNTWQLYDELVEYAGSVMVVHPPHVALITRSQVMNDKIAASILPKDIGTMWPAYWQKDFWLGSGCRRKKYVNYADW